MYGETSIGRGQIKEKKTWSTFCSESTCLLKPVLDNVITEDFYDYKMTPITDFVMCSPCQII